MWETGEGFAPGALAAGLAPALVDVPLVILPASADGRDLAPRLAAVMDRPLLAGAECVALSSGDDGRPHVVASVARLDDRVLVDVTVEGPAVATLIPHRRDGSEPDAGRVIDRAAACRRGSGDNSSDVDGRRS